MEFDVSISYLLGCIVICNAYKCFVYSVNVFFNSLNFFRPELFSWDKVIKMAPHERLEHAFNIAKNCLGIEKLLDPEGTIMII